MKSWAHLGAKTNPAPTTQTTATATAAEETQESAPTDEPVAVQETSEPVPNNSPAASSDDWVATDKTTEPSLRAASDAPRLRPGLQLGITVLVAGEKEIDEPAKRISAAGTLSLPLIGLVECSGLTLEELTAKLTTSYAEFLQEPIVDVDFVVENGPDAISPWGQVTVLGRIKKPGQINIPPTREISLSKAIQLAGGLDTSAKISSIRVTRRDEFGQTRQMDINFQAIGVQGSIEKDLPLQDGDVIFVPESVF